MNTAKVAQHISEWLLSYCENAGMAGFIIGISGGVDSALTSTLCALTGKKVVLVNMPIRQSEREYKLASSHIENLVSRFENVQASEVNLTAAFTELEKAFNPKVVGNFLSMANSRSRLRMLTLYALGQEEACLVAGTGNKVEDFGIGFFTKYGDGGVDLSPIADLSKSQVWELAAFVGVDDAIVSAKPTDGLWEDGRCDEDQIGASYPELEWAMEFKGDENLLTERETEILYIYRRLHKVNQHKMQPIPVCLIPAHWKK